jgi:hypothetical protein
MTTVTGRTGGGGGSDVFIVAPFLAMLRYGTDATLKSRNRFGAGIGFGGEYVFQNPIDAGYWHPAVIGEVSFRIQVSTIKLQYIRDFGYNAMNDGIEMTHWGFYICASDLFKKR